MTYRPTNPPEGKHAFTLVELCAALAVIAMLLAAGIPLLGTNAARQWRAATDMTSGLIDQARTTAIASRATILLAIIDPADLEMNDDICRIGLFKVNAWPDDGPIEATRLGRWHTLPSGTIIAGGTVDGLRNPRDEAGLDIRCGDQTLHAHALAFTPRGGLRWPQGSDSVVLSIAEGGYRNGKANARSRPRNHLKIGRVTARPLRYEP